MKGMCGRITGYKVFNIKDSYKIKCTECFSNYAKYTCILDDMNYNLCGKCFKKIKIKK